MRYTWATVRGALVGATTMGVLQLASTVWAILTTDRDEGSTRATAAISALGDERWRFALGVAAGVAAVGALAGAIQAVLRALLRGGRAPRHAALRDLGFTTALVFVIVLGRASAAPALVGPALPIASVMGWLAVHVPPVAFYALPIGTAFGMILLAFRRQRRAEAASAILAMLVIADSVVMLAIARSPRPRYAAGAPAGTPPNILVLAADSIRPDHLSALGYARPTTPNIDKLAAEGTLFERAMAPLAMTTPSWTSILTGRYPHGHGIRHMFPDRRLRADSLDALPRLAAEKGYRTVVVTDYAGDFFPIFEFGFQHQHTPPPLNTRTVFQRELLTRSPLALALLEPLPEGLRPHVFRYMMNAADPERLADEVLGELDQPGPFLIVVFFSNTHVPFASRYPHDLRFTDPAYDGEHRFAYNLSSIGDIARADTPVSPADAAQLIGLYDGALSSVDTAVGRILAGLDTRGLTDRTVVTFLADHGENLFEPGQTTLHGKWFRGGDEANRVPLVFRGPGVAAGQRVTQPVSLTDVAPTIAEWLGWRSLSRAEGRALGPAMRGQELGKRPVFAETGAWMTGPVEKDGVQTPSLFELVEPDREDDGQLVLKPRHEDIVTTAKHRALWDGNLKLIYEPTTIGVRFHLYDVATDPAQTKDILSNSPRAGALIEQMFQWLRRDPERELDPRGHVVRRGG